MEKIILLVGVILVLTPIQFLSMQPIIKTDWRIIAKERVEGLSNVQKEGPSNSPKASSDQKVFENLLIQCEILKDSNFKGFLLIIVVCLISGLILLAFGSVGVYKKYKYNQDAEVDAQKTRAT